MKNEKKKKKKKEEKQKQKKKKKKKKNHIGERWRRACWLVLLQRCV